MKVYGMFKTISIENVQDISYGLYNQLHKENEFETIFPIENKTFFSFFFENEKQMNLMKQLDMYNNFTKTLLELNDVDEPSNYVKKGKMIIQLANAKNKYIKYKTEFEENELRKQRNLTKLLKLQKEVPIINSNIEKCLYDGNKISFNLIPLQYNEITQKVNIIDNFEYIVFELDDNIKVEIVSDLRERYNLIKELCDEIGIKIEPIFTEPIKFQYEERKLLIYKIDKNMMNNIQFHIEKI